MTHACVVTNSNVDTALFCWVKYFNLEKGEVASGLMLQAKRTYFENQFNVPENERLQGPGWSGSVDPAVARAEQERCAAINADYAPEDILNDDETGCFWKATPDRGLTIVAMHGKKQDRTCITLHFVVNSTGMEAFPIMFIGRYNKPRCFGKIGPNERVFYYRFNKTAWQTSELYEEHIKKLDLYFERQGRKVILWSDNFSGHDITYKPKNIRLERFEPNLTSFVQPLDQGIIRAFKAHFQRLFCLRAVERDEAGERNVYEINLLEVMHMVQKAWGEVTQQTIVNCWRKSGIALVVPVTRSMSTKALPQLQGHDLVA
ncbi:DDE-domain-containing protein [Dendrothele bispora CBS 962.96]|uniref:DDE-domain-containing protein n=1 Tax=Dendrothele bispora (strain CBS 962.96) TaxID=1314807 RepID=A0A4S8MPC3_DENBC|nr:DDE-domain-containing protein [Dendrothele bispora CBS 962.96]